MKDQFDTPCEYKPMVPDTTVMDDKQFEDVSLRGTITEFDTPAVDQFYNKGATDASRSTIEASPNARVLDSPMTDSIAK